jgi:hypothetical protein
MKIIKIKQNQTKSSLYQPNTLLYQTDHILVGWRVVEMGEIILCL